MSYSTVSAAQPSEGRGSEGTCVEMHAEEVAEEQGQVLDKLLVPRVAAGVGSLEVERDGDDVGNGGQDLGEHLDELLVVRVGLAGASSLEAADLGQALKGDVPELGDGEEARAQGVDQGGLEDVAKRDPVAESEKGLERRLDEAGLVGRGEDLLAELKDLRKLGTHGLLQVPRLGRRHLLGRVVKDLLGQQAEDDHVVLANREVGVAGRDDFVDERGPVVGPFLLENGDEDEVELVEKGLVASQSLLGARALDDELDDEVPDTWVGPRQPTRRRHGRQDRKGGTRLGTDPAAGPSILWR